MCRESVDGLPVLIEQGQGLEIDYILTVPGIAFGKDEKSTGTVYKDADLALSEAKKERNRVVFYTDLTDIQKDESLIKEKKEA